MPRVANRDKPVMVVAVMISWQPVKLETGAPKDQALAPQGMTAREAVMLPGRMASDRMSHQTTVRPKTDGATAGGAMPKDGALPDDATAIQCMVGMLGHWMPSQVTGSRQKQGTA